MMKATAFSLLLVGCFLIVQGRSVQQDDGQPDPRCQGRLGIFPIPGDCTHYLVCRENESAIRECPDDFEFHPVLYCTFPEIAECSVAYHSATQTDEFPCSREYGMVPYPRDCRKYVICSEGHGKVETCPDNTGFVEFVGCTRTMDCPADLESRYEASLVGEQKSKQTSEKDFEIDFVCTEDGLFSHPTDCRFFVRCSMGEHSVFECANGQHFDRDARRCGDPRSAHCDNNIQARCQGRRGIFPIPGDCTHYLVCRPNESAIRECPDGLEFHPILYCTFPEEADCSRVFYSYFIPQISPNAFFGGGSEDSFFGGGLKGAVLGAGLEGAVLGAGLEDSFFGGGSEDEFFGILSDDEFPCPRKYGMVPYPGDCGKYVTCSEGLGKVETCPDNTGFVEYVGCTETKDCPADLGSRDEASLASLVGEQQSQQPPTKDFEIDFVCTENGHFSHPTDCRFYVRCSMGKHRVMECANGQHFNNDTRRCEHPCSAQCDKNIQEIYRSYENSPASIPRAPEYDFACTLSGIYQNPKDCGSFIKCKDDKAFTVSCPSGLHYSEDTQTCVQPCKAECDPSFATECGWDKPWISENYSKSPEFSDFSAYHCMDEHFVAIRYKFNCIHDSVYSHPECDKYVVCEHKIPHVMPCPNGLHWSEKERICDWPCNAHCDSSLACECGWPACKRTDIATGLSENETQTIEQNFNDTTEFSMDDQSVNKCEERDATYPHDEDCHQYIDCVNGVSKVEKCPPGKAFDPDQRDCIDERQVSTCHWS